VALLDEGCTQGIVHDRLHVSRSFVSQTITFLESLSLLKKIPGTKYNIQYEVSEDLRQYLKHDAESPKISACRVHNIRRKYRIISQSHKVSEDKRAGFIKSWPMRGWLGYKFWFSGKVGEPNVTVDVTPKTIVAYPDKHQQMVAGSIQEAEDRMNMAVHNAVQKFVEMQARFGVHMQIDNLGMGITDPHYGFALSKGTKYAEEGTALKGCDVDGSPADLGEPDKREFETKDRKKATALDRMIQRSELIDDKIESSIRKAMPDAMKVFEEKLTPIGASVLKVEALLQGGITISTQYEQMLNFMTRVLGEMSEIRKENADLKASLKKTVSRRKRVKKIGTN
jgi:hypothetical protein